jgi:hypothetical protein
MPRGLSHRRMGSRPIGYHGTMGETDDDRQDLIERIRRADAPNEMADAFLHARGWLLEHPDDEAVKTQVEHLFERVDGFTPNR